MINAVGIIPARFGSSRLEGKPILDICGKPMIQHVYERVKRSRYLHRAIIATDDKRILDRVADFGGEAVLTGKHHTSGTERVWEVAEYLDYDIIVNIQGDEPLIEPQVIDNLIEAISSSGDTDVAVYTFCSKIFDREDLYNPNIVKVVFDYNHIALYFSRLPIPYRWDNTISHFKHIGIYGYTKTALKQFCSMPQSPLEQAEHLEQLRIIENTGKIKVLYTEYSGLGVDTIEDLEKVRRLLASG